MLIFGGLIGAGSRSCDFITILQLLSCQVVISSHKATMARIHMQLLPLCNWKSSILNQVLALIIVEGSVLFGFPP